MYKNTNYKKIKKAALCFFALLLLCYIPMLDTAFSYSEKEVVVERENLQYVSLKDTEVNQLVYIEGELKSLTIYFYAPSGSMYNDSVVNVSLTQGDNVVTNSIVARRIAVESSYDRQDDSTFEDEQMLRFSRYSMEADFSCIEEGEAMLTLCGIGIPEGTDLFCLVSDTITSGLPSASANSNVLGHPLAIEYEVMVHNMYYVYDIIMLAILLLLLLVVAWSFSYKGDLLKTNCLYLYAFFIIFTCISIQAPTAVWFGNPRSEAVYEFWYKAHTMSFGESLMSLMSGESLAWCERILMWIADRISPIQYVFVVAQVMEAVLISALAAMPCLKTFNKYFGKFERLCFSIVLGVFTLYLKAYYFWSVSYWAVIFIVLFWFVDMKKLKNYQYLLALCFTIILCVSRIFHVIFIPVAIVVLLTIGKKQGRRFRVYCYTLILACSFEGIYSMAAGTSLVKESSLLQNIGDIGVGRIIENTIYYEVQVINSLLYGKEHMVGLTANIIGLLVIMGVIGFCIYSLLHKGKSKTIGCILLGLGILSFGTIAITVITSGSYEQVQFPHNYSTKVDWNCNYFQNCDLHFTYAYISLLFILVCFIYVLKNKVFDMMKKSIKSDEYDTAEKKIQNIFKLCIYLLLLNLVVVNAKQREKIDNSLAADWNAYYTVVDNECCFMPVNVIYRAAQISLEQNSDTWIYGIDVEGNGYFWENGDEVYTFDKPYSKADVGCISDIDTKSILSITTKKAITNFDICYVAVLRDDKGNELARIRQSNDLDRVWIDFVFDEPISGVDSIEFETEEGMTAFVENAIQIGVVSYE